MMLDPTEKGSESEDMISSGENQIQTTDPKKSCADCGTTKTPLWRGGPAGPKSLCNACGIRSRKRRRAVLTVNNSGSNTLKGKRSSISRNYDSGSKIRDSMKCRLLAFGREVMWHRSKAVDQQRMKLGEVEQAAVLLMALSCGSVYAI